MNKIAPSYDLTPSRAFKNPEKDNLDPTNWFLAEKIASTSSSKMIEWGGASQISLFKTSSVTLSLERFR